MPSNLHDGFIPGSALCKLRDQRMSIIVPATLYLGILPDIVPSGFQCRYMPSWIRWLRSTKGEDVPFRLYLAEFLLVPRAMVRKGIVQLGVKWNSSAFPSFCFCPSNTEEFGLQVDLGPGESPDLGISHASISRKHESQLDVWALGFESLRRKPFSLTTVKGFADLRLDRKLQQLFFRNWARISSPGSRASSRGIEPLH